jgi:hypothetical protein
MRSRLSGLFFAALLFSWSGAQAEPYLAVEAGLRCSVCHVNPSGGGKRTLFGMTYARTRIAERNILVDDEPDPWNSAINRWVGIGGDYRGGYSNTRVPGQSGTSDWVTEKATLQLEIKAIEGLLTIYGDQQLAPGDSLNRESFVLLTPRRGKYTIKAGQFFLPFGLRLQDDNTFVRQRSGINFTTPDEGVEFGVELPKWSVQAAFTDGTAGAGSAPGKEQTSLSAVYALARWRLGASYNVNEDPLGDRTMQALFAGWRTGPVSWLAEIDFIRDDLPGGGSTDIYATLLEGNWRFRKGHNLKVAYEFQDPSDDVTEDEEERYSIVWEYSPFQLFQARAGYRVYNGVPLFPATNRETLFLELHAYF